jgi:mitochondrial import inner membrane translocase subunit TIM21
MSAGKLSPHGIFNRAFAAVQSDSDVANHFGTPLNAYGRDHGGHREGRRNFIEHEEFVDPATGRKRCRVRFNLKGPFGHAFVFAEACESLPANEWVYLMVQDTSTGHVITLQDNRAILASQAAAGSPEEADALRQLGRGSSR